MITSTRNETGGTQFSRTIESYVDQLVDGLTGHMGILPETRKPTRKKPQTRPSKSTHQPKKEKKPGKPKKTQSDIGSTKGPRKGQDWKLHHVCRMKTAIDGGVENSYETLFKWGTENIRTSKKKLVESLKSMGFSVEKSESKPEKQEKPIGERTRCPSGMGAAEFMSHRVEYLLDMGRTADECIDELTLAHKGKKYHKALEAMLPVLLEAEMEEYKQQQQEQCEKHEQQEKDIDSINEVISELKFKEKLALQSIKNHTCGPVVLMIAQQHLRYKNTRERLEYTLASKENQVKTSL